MAGAVAFIRKDNLFLFHLRDDKDIPCPNMWALFGGGVEPGETPEKAVLREIREETGIVPDSCVFLTTREAKLPLQEGHRMVTEHVFFARTTMDVVELREGQAYEWMSLDAYLLRRIPEPMRSLITEYRDALTG